MWELIVCVSVTWSTSCQLQPPIYFPNAYFCERAAEQIRQQRKNVTQIYCKEA